MEPGRRSNSSVGKYVDRNASVNPYIKITFVVGD